MRLTGIIMCMTAALAIWATTFTKGWYGYSEGDFTASMGLWSTETCVKGELFNDKCESQSHQPISKVENGKAQLVFMKLTLYFAPAAALLLFIVAGLGLFGSGGTRLLGWLGVGASGVALILGAAILITKPDLYEMISASWGAYLYIVGCLAGGAGSLLVAISPPEAKPLPMTPYGVGHGSGPYTGQPPYGPAAQPQGPACPRCRAPAVWVGQYQRWYCPACSAYL